MAGPWWLLIVVSIVCTSAFGAYMAAVRGMGYERPYRLLLAAMGAVACVAVILWQTHAEGGIGPGGAVAASCAWLGTAAASTNRRVNPGVLFFALCETVMIAAFHSETGQPVSLQIAAASGLVWAAAGYGVATERGNPGILFIALCVSIAMFAHPFM